MDVDRPDCTWCGSAASIEHGLCQVCLMEYPVETKIIPLPLDRPAKQKRSLDAPAKRTIDLTEDEVGVAD